MKTNNKETRKASELNDLLYWHNCENELPDNSDREVLIKHKNYNHYFIGTYYGIGDRWFLRKEIGHVDTSEITYWMPLPAEPV